MRYISTRGGIEPISFGDAVLMGLADDGGLLVPESLPDSSRSLEKWRGLPYPDLAAAVMTPFLDDFESDEVKEICALVYGQGYGGEVAPLRALGQGRYLLELFHGPTLAFKDVALQLLGEIFERLLRRRGQQLRVLAATSGDTGSAAIAGLRGRPGMQIYVMHPRGRVARLQELQMTTVLDANVYNIAIDGTFDDCQRLMKSVAGDLDFKKKFSLGAVNSVNWARVLAQTVYYFAAYLQLPQAGPVSFAVPTGNFGNILAGWYAYRMGLPVQRLMLASNANDILPRYFQTGNYSRGEVHHTLAPAMDIQVASNFERYLYHLHDDDSSTVVALMSEFAQNGQFRTEHDHTIFASQAVDDEQVVETVAAAHRQTSLILDPHTATAWRAAAQLEPPAVVISTAHPAKFPEAVGRAIKERPTHPILEAIKERPTRRFDLSNDADKLKEFIESHAAEIPSAEVPQARV